MMLSNVGGFVCHIVNAIVLLYGIVFYPDTTETFTSAFVYVAVFEANMLGLFFAASAGIIVNHMVDYVLLSVIVTFKRLIQYEYDVQ